MAITVTYQHPVAGLVAPTALQTSGLVTATVIKGADGDVAAVITHNMGLSAADLAAGFPKVTLTPTEQITAVLSDWTVAALGANAVTLAATAAVGSGSANPQLTVHIERPHSLVR
jgi:hypothetical protein